MKMVNVDYISGQEIETLELVKGTVVMSKNIGKDFMQGMKSIVGGELKSYTEMLAEARNIASGRMVREAEALGADAIINVKYSSSAIVQGAAEILVWGTAVKFK